MDRDDRGGGGESVVPAAVRRVNEGFVFKVGISFNSEEEAYATYNAYGLKKGFGVRKGSCSYNKHGELSRREFCCSCEGYSRVLAPNEERKRERLEYRCGCKARIVFKVAQGVYEVTNFIDDHNHLMIEDDKKHFISSGRHLPEYSRAVLGSVKAKRVCKSVANESEVAQKASFTEQDYLNFLRQCRKSLIRGVDAQSVLNHLKSMQVQDSNFFYAIQSDEEGRIMNLFWRDGMSRLQYESFGDVIIFDTSYRTNKYNMVCAPFVGVNNHGTYVFFGSAFLSDETQYSLMWLFNTFVEAMGGRTPKTIFTDEDASMVAALRKVLPSTRHCFCEWHVEESARKNIPFLMKNSGFRDKYFNKLLWDVSSDIGFESMWQQMVNEFHLLENSWIKNLYSQKEKWSPAYTNDCFSAGVKSTQRNSITNTLFSQTVCDTMSLSNLVKHYEEKASKMRDLELQNDYKSRGRPRLLIEDCGILKHASTVYTNAIFSEFQHEFLQGVSQRIADMKVEGSRRIFTLQHGHTVQFDTVDSSVTCNCHKFETMGYLCRHALRVLHTDLEFTAIPAQYVLKRWTMGAKQGLEFENYVNGEHATVASSATSSLSTTDRFNGLMRRASAVMRAAASNDHLTNMAGNLLENAERMLSDYQSGAEEVIEESAV